MSATILFIDDGGVLNDNALRGPQWQHHVGEFMASRLGGRHDDWAEANRLVVPPLWQKYRPIMGGATDPNIDVVAMWNAYQLDWLQSMAQAVGRPIPSSEAECLALTTEASIYVTERVRSAYPGAIATLRRLHVEGYSLNTASNQVSHELDGYLRGMDVRELFPAKVYGQDLLGMAKGHPIYYERLFADTQVSPADALVVDDSPSALRHAASVGSRTVLVAPVRPVDYNGNVIASFADIWQVLPER